MYDQKLAIKADKESSTNKQILGLKHQEASHFRDIISGKKTGSSRNNV